MSQPKVLPTGVRILIGVVLGLLGFAFPLLFVPAALILWSVFAELNEPTTTYQPHDDQRSSTQALKVKPTGSIARTKPDTATSVHGQLTITEILRQASPPPEGSDQTLKVIESIAALNKLTAGSSTGKAAITPAEFLRKYGITCFYHFTDTRNLASIKLHGGLLPWSQVKGKVAAPGGNDWSHDADAIKGQDHYIHLCFLPEHPMEFVAKRDGRILESRFLRIDTSIIHTPGILFCPDVGNKSGVPMLELAEAVSQMDFEIIAPAHRQWLDPPLFERKKIACKYELLVPCKIPLTLISGL